MGRLDRHRHDVLRFAVDFAVPFDNNQAERSTAREQGQHALTALRRVFEGDAWQPGFGSAWSASGP